jgi:hypothetical protein
MRKNSTVDSEYFEHTLIKLIEDVNKVNLE